MRFNQLDSRSSQSARQSRSRVTALVVALVMVILGIQLAADPATWSWLFPPLPQDQGPAAHERDSVSYPLAGTEPASLESEQIRSDSTPAADGAVPSSANPLLEGIDFSSIEDNTLGLRATEMDAYRALLSRFREISPNALADLAERTPHFGAVMLEPDHYRGDVFEIRGLARRILPLPTAEGSPPLYELWVFTRDSGINPWRVVATDIPDNLPHGVHKDGIPVRLTGLFFKLQAYETQRHEPHIAPLLLAKTVDSPQPQAVPSSSSVDLAPWILTALIAGAIGVVIWQWRVRRSDARFEQHILKHYTKSSEESSEAEVDPAVFLQNLSTTPLPEEAGTHVPQADSQNRDTGR